MKEAAPFSETVTVVMPTHNRAHLVSRAIESVLAQSHAAFSLIVVDDGSKDDTREVVARFREPRIRHVHRETAGGPAEARNTGIRAAGPSGFLAFLDDDDEWLPRKLELQLAVFRASPVPLAAVGCGRTHCYENREEIQLPEYRGDVFEDLLARRARGYAAQHIVVRRTPGQEDLLFDLALPPLEDLDYSIRTALRGPFDFVAEPLVRIYNDYEGPHVWNTEAAVRGYEQLGLKYARELDSRPWIRSYYDVCMARDLALLGRLAECRERLKRARDGGSSGRLAAWYAASLLGARGLKAAARLLPIAPPRRRSAA